MANPYEEFLSNSGAPAVGAGGTHNAAGPASQIPWTAIAIIVVAVLFIFRDRIAPKPVDPKQPDAPSVIQVPSVASIIEGKDDQSIRRLGSLYAAISTVLDRVQLSGKEITSGQLAAFTQDADVLNLIGTDAVGKFPGLGAAVNDELTKVVPLEDRPLTKAEIASAADLFSRLATTCGRTQ